MIFISSLITWLLGNSGENQRRKKWREGERKRKEKEKKKGKRKEKVQSAFTKNVPLDFLYNLRVVLMNMEEFETSME